MLGAARAVDERSKVKAMAKASRVLSVLIEVRCLSQNQLQCVSGHCTIAKQDAYKDNDKDKYKKTRYAAEKAGKTGKAKYRDKLEENLTTNNSKNIWQGLKAIINYKPSPKNTTATDTNLPDRLNDFYSRFEKVKLLPLSLHPHPSLLS
ncbi:hypothetical protein NP493_778g04035 [Ridgeia piscesae]|uniref:Uncharacterized protein n=1 Tax=Ridgeia piscesae TaxID=27915 RepID=A0AAD9NPM3_RIDPI|nr:hypothetical protein NP493_778g04035 [Ridgeia piscesae]